MHERRAGRERGGQVQHRRQRLVHRLDGGQGRLRRLEGDRGHRRERLAHVADHVRGEDRLVLHRGAIAHVGGVGRGDDRAHAGHGRGAGGVDPHQTGVRLAAAEDLAVEHAGQREVGGIDGRARHLARRVDARERLPDDARRRGHGATACPARRSDALRTASTIFWYPVHRHRLPESASRTCASVGRGHSSRYAFAERIMPGMQ